MILIFTLDKEDFLTHQLFIASTSERILKKRKRSRILVPIFYLIFGLFLFSSQNNWMAILFCFFAVGWFFIYPLWESNKYIKHYEGFLMENYKNRFEKEVIIEFTEELIISKDETGESKIIIKEIEEIVEISNYIFIRLKSGHSIILPLMKIKNNTQVFLKSLTEKLGVPYRHNPVWKWA